MSRRTVTLRMAPRMHQNMQLETPKNKKKYPGRGAVPPHIPPPYYQRLYSTCPPPNLNDGSAPAWTNPGKIGLYAPPPSTYFLQ